METIADRLRRKMQEQGLSQYRLWKDSGVSQPTIKRILDRESLEPDKSTVTKLAKVLGCSYSWLYDGKDNLSESVKAALPAGMSHIDNASPFETRQPQKLPLISWVAAGMMRDAEDAYAIGHAYEWMDSPFQHGEHAFLLTVEGDSMYHPDGSGYSHGEIIQVEPGREAGHGNDVVVRTPDGKATFKRYKIGPDGPYLEALNPHWPERIIKVPEGTIVCGVVVGSWRKRGS